MAVAVHGYRRHAVRLTRRSSQPLTGRSVRQPIGLLSDLERPPGGPRSGAFPARARRHPGGCRTSSVGRGPESWRHRWYGPAVLGRGGLVGRGTCASGGRARHRRRCATRTIRWGQTQSCRWNCPKRANGAPLWALSGMPASENPVFHSRITTLKHLQVGLALAPLTLDRKGAPSNDELRHVR